MRKVEFHPEAEREMNESADFYEAHRPEYGTKFLKAVRAGRNAVRRHPERFPFEDAPYRKYGLQKYKHNLIYRVHPDVIYIYAVAHHSRRHGYWKERL